MNNDNLFTPFEKPPQKAIFLSRPQRFLAEKASRMRNIASKNNKKTGKKKPKTIILGFNLSAWQFPTFAWQTATLSSALNGFTSEFGMGSGGSRSLWSPSKLVCWRLDQRQATGRWIFGLSPALSDPVVLEICNTHILCSLYFGFIFCYFIFLLFFVFLFLLFIAFCCFCYWRLSWHTRLVYSSFIFITPQTDWVLYGQASRAISTR